MNIKSNILARIIKDHWNYIDMQFNSYQKRTLFAIRNCRTPAMGGHVYICDKCGHKHKRYNSCRNRHCPQCQNTQQEKWVSYQQEKLINTSYYHLVFTIPHILNELFLSYQSDFYDSLMKKAWETLSQFGWNHKYLGAQLGTTMILHTWGSNLSYHPHVHCIVPGGGVSIQNKWKQANGNGKFLFPVKAMSPVFKEKMIEAIKLLMSQHGLKTNPTFFDSLNAKSWVVYAKPAMGGPDSVIKYLARYSHKIAISHHRIIDYDGQSVTFTYKDYRHGNVTKTMILSATEFIRRFTLHILPKGFRKIRHFGMLSGAWKHKVFPISHKKTKTKNWEEIWLSIGININQCPNCKTGTLDYLAKLDPVRGPPVKITQHQSVHLY